MLVRYAEESPVLSFLKRYLFLLTLVPWYLYQMCYMADIPILGQSPVYLEIRADQLTMVVLAVQILLLQRYSLKQLAVILPMTAVFYAAAQITCANALLYGWLFLLAARDQDLDLAVKTVYILQICMTVLTFVLFARGILTENLLETSAGAPRHSWGFTHPNTLGCLFLHMAACRTYLRRNRLNLLDLVLTAASLVFVWLVPYSRSSVACLLLLLILSAYALVEKRLPEKAGNTVRLMIVIFAVVCNLFSVLASVFYSSKSEVFTLLNRLLTKRLSYAKKAYRIYGISLFGRFLPDGFTMAEYNGQSFRMPYLDSAYINLLLKFGLFSYLGYSAAYLLAMIRKWKAGELILLGILAIFAAHSVMEPSLYEMRYNLFILFLCCIFRSPDVQKN